MMALTIKQRIWSRAALHFKVGAVAWICVFNVAPRNVPMDTAENADFRTFALNWWGKQPSINGIPRNSLDRALQMRTSMARDGAILMNAPLARIQPKLFVQVRAE